MSYIARMVYSYKDRYVLTATFRADGSSKFSKENRFSYFPRFRRHGACPKRNS